MTTPQVPTPAAAVVECIDCAKLPTKAELLADRIEGDLADELRVSLLRSGVDYRPAKPRPIADGCGPRSPRCAYHKRALKKAASARARGNHKERRFGLTPELQLILWTLQGGKCPCGAKAAPTVPPGVALDHDHEYAAAHCDHPPEDGCIDCLLGYLCQPGCNRDIVGRLTGHGRKRGGRVYALAALKGLVDFLEHPPIELLRAHLAAKAAPDELAQLEQELDVVDVPVTRKDTAA